MGLVENSWVKILASGADAIKKQDMWLILGLLSGEGRIPQIPLVATWLLASPPMGADGGHLVLGQSSSLLLIPLSSIHIHKHTNIQCFAITTIMRWPTSHRVLTLVLKDHSPLRPHIQNLNDLHLVISHHQHDHHHDHHDHLHHGHKSEVGCCPWVLPTPAPICGCNSAPGTGYTEQCIVMQCNAILPRAPAALHCALCSALQCISAPGTGLSRTAMLYTTLHRTACACSTSTRKLASSGRSWVL